MAKILKVTIDPEFGTGYVYFQKPYKGISKSQIVVTDDIILDFDKDDRLVGIEVLDSILAKKLRGPRKLDYKMQKPKKSSNQNHKRQKRKRAIDKAIRDAEKRGSYEIAEHLTSKIDLD